MTFEAATNGTVFVSGAVQYTGWAPYTLNSNINFTGWPNKWGLCPGDSGNAPFQPDIVNRREMLVVNGIPMTQVLTLSEMIYPGTFFVDESAALVFVWPPSGTDMTTADVEVATNPNPMLIQSNNTQTLNGVVIRGLTFEYGNPCHSDPAVTASGQVTNVIFDTDTFQWNNGHGLMLNNPITNVTVVNSIANHNGASGFQTYEAKNILFQNVQASYNNWRGAQGVYYTWNTGGIHSFSDHTDIISGATLAFNQTHTIHWDTNNENIGANSIFAANNVVGVEIEKNDGPIAINNSQFCNIIGGDAAGGLVFRNSENTTVSSCTVYNQSPSEVMVTGVAGGILVTNWETGEIYNLVTEGLSFTNNVVEDMGTAETLFRDSSLVGADWTAFVSTLQSDSNTWWDSANVTPFVVPTPAHGTSDTFGQWQSVTAQDAHSTFSPPAIDPSTLCSATADGPDFWLLSTVEQITADAAGNSTFPLTLYSLGGLTGIVNLSIDLSSIAGAAATFSPSALPLSGASTLNVTTPATLPAGTYTATVLANTGNITRTAALSIIVPTTAVRLSTTSLDFGSVTIGVTSPTQTVILTNNGSTPLGITSITVPAGFSQTNTCGSSVAAGTSCTLSVSFSPKKLVTYSGALDINDSDPTSPQKINLSGIPIGAPVVTLTPKSLTFSQTVYLAASPSKIISLQNTGTADLHMTSITVTGANPADFIQTNDCAGDIAINGTCTITVTFTPMGSGARSASISIADDAVVTPATASLSGTGTAAITISPKTLTFSSTVIGNTSTAKTVTVTNGSTAAIAMTGFTFSGTNALDFTQTNTCGLSLAGGAQCTVSVTFTPDAPGTLTAILSINDSDPSGPQSVTLTGTGKASTVILSPAALSFGNQVYLTPSASQTVTLTNSATTSLSITSIAVVGTNPADFIETNTCGTKVKNNASCTITVTFDPSGIGARSATITINDSATGSPQNIPVDGTGVAAITVSPGSLLFSATPIGTTSSPQVVTVTNGGSSAIAITSLSITGTNPSDFAQTNTCGSNLAGGSSCALSVTFTASAAGARSATLSITDGDPSSPQTVAISGTGASGAVTLSPTSLTFPSTPYLKRTSMTVTLTNSGSAALSITSITVTGTNQYDFKQTNTCRTSVAAGQSCTLTVTFTPGWKGTRTASLSINDSAAGSSQVVSLSGIGVAAIAVSPATLSFLSTPVNTSSTPQTITVTNASSAAFTIGPLTFYGPNAADFTQTNNCGTSLSGGASCSITVTFEPRASGTRTGTLTISDGDPTSPQQVVTLSGTGS